MYPTTADLVAGSTVEALTSLSNEQQDALREEAILVVEGACGQSFTVDGAGSGGPAETAKTLDGSGGRTLNLPRRLSRLVSLTTADGALSADAVGLNDRRDRLHIRDAGPGGSWATRAIAEATGAEDRRFPYGPGTVEVTGVWGWTDEEFPEAVATALRCAMEDRAVAGAHALADTARSAALLGVDALQQGNLSMSLRGGEDVVSVRVRRLLQDAGLIWDPTAAGLA